MSPLADAQPFAALSFDELDRAQGGCNQPCTNCGSSSLTSPLISPLGLGTSPADWDAAAQALAGMANGQLGFVPYGSYGAQPTYGAPVYGPQPLYGPGSGTGTGGGLGNGMGMGMGMGPLPVGTLVAAGSIPYSGYSGYY